MTTLVRTARTSLDHGFARFLRMIITGGLAAAILNLLAWWYAEAINGTSLVVMPPGTESPEALNIVFLLMIGLLAAIGAALLYWILDSITNSPMLWFIIASIIVLVGAYFGPAGLPSDLVSSAAKNWLQILHITTAVGIIWAVAYVSGWFPIRNRS